MEEMQKFMTVTGEGGPCLFYPQETEKPKRIDNVGTVLKPLCDGLDSVFAPFIGRFHDGVVSNSDFSAEIDSLLNSAQGVQQSTQNPTINTYPFGVKTGIFPYYLAVCRTPKYPLSEALEKIDNWCKEWYDPSKGKTSRGISKHVLIITDRWDPADFQPYEDKFREFAMHEDFWFIFIRATNNGLYDISFLPHEFYKFTRHVTDSIRADNWIDNKNIPNTNISLKEPFEGLAEINVSADGKSPYHCIIESGKEKYCVTTGSYRVSGNGIGTAIAIGKWDDKRKRYSALAQVPYPITKEYREQKPQDDPAEYQKKKENFLSKWRRNGIHRLSQLNRKPKDDIFKVYNILSK